MIDNLIIKDTSITSSHQYFELLFKNHFSLLYNYGLKLTKDNELVKDSIQELFLRIWRNGIDIQKITNTRAYLLKGLRHQLINTLELKYNTLKKIEIDETYSIDFSPEDYIIESQVEMALSKKIVNALNKLSNKQREAIYLRYYENLEYDDIVDIMDINYQSVKNNIQRGLTSLKEILGTAIFLLFIKEVTTINGF